MANIGNSLINFLKEHKTFLITSTLSATVAAVLAGIFLLPITDMWNSKSPLKGNTQQQPTPSKDTVKTETSQTPIKTNSASPSNSYVSPTSAPSTQIASPLPSSGASSSFGSSPIPSNHLQESSSGNINITTDYNVGYAKKVGPNKYQMKNGAVELRATWVSISYNNTVSSSDCEMILTISGPAKAEGEERTAKCSNSEGVSLKFSTPGDYTINVEDKVSGNKGSLVVHIVK